MSAVGEVVVPGPVFAVDAEGREEIGLGKVRQLAVDGVLSESSDDGNAARAVEGFRSWVVDHGQVGGGFDPVGLIVDDDLAAGGVGAVVVAVEARAHGKEVLDGDLLLARVGVGVAGVSEVREYGFVVAGEGSAIDGYASEAADDGFGRGAKLMGAIDAVAVEVLFEDELAVLVEEGCCERLYMSRRGHRGRWRSR